MVFPVFLDCGKSVEVPVDIVDKDQNASLRSYVHEAPVHRYDLVPNKAVLSYVVEAVPMPLNL